MNFPDNAIAYLVILYSLSSLVRLYFYLPQIRSVVRSNDASAIHVPTWVVWTCHNVITTIYACFVTGDVPFALFSGVSAGFTSLIAMMAAKKQQTMRLALQPAVDDVVDKDTHVNATL